MLSRTLKVIAAICLTAALLLPILAYLYGQTLTHDGPVPNQNGMVVAGLGLVVSLAAAVLLILLSAGFYVAGRASES